MTTGRDRRWGVRRFTIPMLGEVGCKLIASQIVAKRCLDGLFAYSCPNRMLSIGNRIREGFYARCTKASLYRQDTDAALSNAPELLDTAVEITANRPSTAAKSDDYETVRRLRRMASMKPWLRTAVARIEASAVSLCVSRQSLPFFVVSSYMALFE